MPTTIKNKPTPITPATLKAQRHPIKRLSPRKPINTLNDRHNQSILQESPTGFPKPKESPRAFEDTKKPKMAINVERHPRRTKKKRNQNRETRKETRSGSQTTSAT